MRPHLRASVAALVAVSLSILAAPANGADRTLDGSLNNVQHPDWGRANTLYPRVTSANYADGKGTPVAGPPTRSVSNRIFNDVSQNLFSENGVTQWGAAWGQFLDHTFGLRQETPGGENAPIAFNSADPLESFRNDLGSIGFTRTPAAPGTGTTSPREQMDVISGYIDASTVYGDTPARLNWLRLGARGGGARLMLPDGYLPTVGERGDASTAPAMAQFSGLFAHPEQTVVAGDVRANENIALTATQTLFAREHNRIVAALPNSLSNEDKFQIARRVVGAEEQYVTYNEFLPALGVKLPAYTGYKKTVNASVTNEFAVVGYRAHSMVHGEIEPNAAAGSYTQAQLDAFEDQGIEVENEGGRVVLVIPLNVSFGNPKLLKTVGLGPVLRGIGGESEYKNDEQIDNQMRSVLFQVPKPGTDPLECLDGPTLPQCFAAVTDLAAIDIERSRDHGMPSYNALRRAYGLAPKTSFTAITGEATDQFPRDPLINQSDPINDPNILDFVSLRNRAGVNIPLGSEAAQTDAVSGTRRSTIAARLRAIYGTVDKLDAFVGMSAERHVAGTEFGELQQAMWAKQFEALRDGDRFYYDGDPQLATITRRYGVSYRQTLAQIIALNTGESTQANVFKTAP